MAEDEEIEHLDEEHDEGIMGFWDHLEDLRMAILRGLAGIVLGIILVVIFFVKVFGFLRMPLDWALEAEPGTLSALTTTKVMGVFGVLVQVCMIGGIAIGLPFVLYNLGRFVAPGLTPRERAVLVPACISTLFLFLLGGLFAFFIVLPAALKFTIFFNNMLGLETIWTAQSYYGFVSWTIIGVGLAFEFPLVIIILQYIGLVSAEQLRSGRRYAVIIIVVAAAFITPGGDPLSLFFLAIPMLLFYEIAIVIGERVTRQKEKWEAEDEENF
ncbi:twin-arginine translocase subunit TatC [Rubellicoccus peritrichatus]|uniref:Sec-independent protein translocase protein TatC n=1 Tax=Rubellicoccus peritrichatus TaxID=3080537 RepID=A0AAQ3QW61_9BACT|nr:twin-arginine translocase subunit TatC [Puniceicoccus sp. CR14]WOO41580.1 twin-arginine translocase subunit TatC [Puniceicoccus sp. CR14]